MLDRRKFLKNTSWAAGGISAFTFSACTSPIEKNKNKQALKIPMQKDLKISLAQWSLHRAFNTKELNPNNFAQIAKNTYDIDAIEYVNQFYVDHAEDQRFWLELKQKADDHGVKSLLIMVDDEGDLGNPDTKARNIAVENHYKWVDAAKLLDCHSIRVNAFGDGTKQEIRDALVDGMSKLTEYAAKEKINVIIENHGLYSSDAKFITEIIKKVGMDNFGTLPDFGNWCTNEKWGSTQNNKCTEVYDRYQGVEEFLPYAKGISAKSYDFDKDGNDTIIDYKKMIELIKASKYDGYIGIEYEGDLLSEDKGIRATKKLLQNTWNS